MTAPQPPALDYFTPPTITPPLWQGIFFFATSVPAGACLWLPFVFGISPLRAVTESAPLSALLSGPFLLGPVIVYWNFRQAIWRRTAKWERWLISLLAFGALVVPIIIGYAIVRSPDPEVIIPAAVSSTVTILGIALTLWLWRKGPRPEVAISALLYTPFLANAFFCLYIFKVAGRNIGWFVTDLACLGLLVELAWRFLATYLANRRSPQPPPSA